MPPPPSSSDRARAYVLGLGLLVPTVSRMGVGLVPPAADVAGVSPVPVQMWQG
jgi:hypothetical protein